MPSRHGRDREEGDLHLITMRLRLSPLTAAHAEVMHVLLADEELYVFTGGPQPLTLDELHNRYTAWESRRSPDGSEMWLNWIVTLADSGATVGWMQATVVERKAELAWLVGIAWQRRGYASEALTALVPWLRQRLRIVEITAHIHPDNEASVVVARRAGMTPTDVVEGGEQLWRSIVS